MLTNADFVILFTTSLANNPRWPPSCVKGIVCLTNMIAEIDTDAHYVYCVRRILSYVAFCIFNEFVLMNFHQNYPKQRQPRISTQSLLTIYT